MKSFEKVERFGKKIAIITDEGESYAYQDLAYLSDLVSRKIEIRSVVFLLCDNNLESICGYLGCLRRKAIVLLLSSKIKPTSLVRLVSAYRPSYVFLPTTRAVEIQSNCCLLEFHTYFLLKLSIEPVAECYEELGVLLTTSGSTGSEKLVRLSYANLWNNAEVIANYLEIRSDDRPILTMPMHYAFGLSIVNSHLAVGATIVLTSQPIIGGGFWKLARDQRATTFGGVPYTFEILKRLKFRPVDIPSLRYVTQAGGKLHADLCLEFIDVCEKNGTKFTVMYGQTEATARMSWLPWEYCRSKVGSIGIAIPGGKFWLADSNGCVITGSNIEGSLYYEGKNVSLGYATDRLDLSRGDENRGVLRTGDIGKRDSDGFYYIVGRESRFLKLFGNRISLDEVEAFLRSYNIDCACAGTDDKLAIHVTQMNDSRDLLRLVSEHTGISQHAFSLVTHKEIPRSESGKIMYSQLG